jgi:regulator of sigma E protease
VQQVVVGSPAEKAGIEAGDRVLTVNGHRVETFNALVNEVVMIPNEKATVTLMRGSKELTFVIKVAERTEVDRFGNKYRLGQIGVTSPPPVYEDASLIAAPGLAVVQTFDVVRQQIKGLGQIITGRRPLSELGGPLKIAKVSGEAMAVGWLAFLSLAALISINLGFINLLPIPMLDGGHLLLYTVEAVRRRPANAAVQEWAFRAGFAVIVGFMLMVTFNDLASFGLFGRG